MSGEKPLATDVFRYSVFLNSTFVYLKWKKVLAFWLEMLYNAMCNKFVSKDDDEEGIVVHVQRGSGWCEVPMLHYSSASEIKVMNLSGMPVTAD